jgi:hypothetical protein
VSSSLNNEDVIAFLTSEKLDKLREEILRLERELSDFGYDPRRGIESYSVSELKELIERAGSKQECLKKSLIKLIDIQEELYRELYRLAGFKELDVDTEIPEKNLMRLKGWLLTGEVVPLFGDSTKFKQALKEIAKILKSCQGGYGDEVLTTLRRVYKRDYDRYRVIKYILEICAKLRGCDKKMDDLELLPLESIATLIDECIRGVGPLKLAMYLETIEGRGKK